MALFRIDTKKPYTLLYASGKPRTSLVRRLVKRLAVVGPEHEVRKPNTQELMGRLKDWDPIATHAVDLSGLCSMLEGWSTYWVKRNRQSAQLHLVFDRYSAADAPTGLTVTFRYAQVPDGNAGISTALAVIRAGEDEWRLLPDAMSRNLPPFSLARLDGSGLVDPRMSDSSPYGEFKVNSAMLRIPAASVPEEARVEDGKKLSDDEYARIEEDSRRLDRADFVKLSHDSQVTESIKLPLPESDRHPPVAREAVPASGAPLDDGFGPSGPVSDIVQLMRVKTPVPAVPDADRDADGDDVDDADSNGKGD